MSQTITAATTKAPACDPATRVTKSLLGYGVIAGPFYVAVSLAQALTRDGFDLTRHAWSMLANGSLGWIQITNLIVTGLMVISGAVGLRRALDQGVGSTWAPGLLSVYGVSMVAGGIFRADPAQGFPHGTPQGATTTSWHGMLHFVSGGIGFVCLVVACFVLARRFLADDLWGWATFSRITGVLFLAGFFTLAAGGGSSWANLAFTAAILLAAAWVSMTSIHHYRRVARGIAG